MKDIFNIKTQYFKDSCCIFFVTCQMSIFYFNKKYSLNRKIIKHEKIILEITLFNY